MDREYLATLLGNALIDISVLRQQIVDRDKVIAGLNEQIAKLTPAPNVGDLPAGG